MKHLVQIVHTPDSGGHNVIERLFDQKYQVEAFVRRHGKEHDRMRKQHGHTAHCEITLMETPDGYSDITE